MTENTTILVAVILFSIVLIALLVLRPSITATRGGKILAFVALLVFPVLAGGMGVNQHIERSKTTNFCLSCHVMEDYGKSLRVDDRSYIPAAHFQYNRVPRDKACYTCHTDYTMYGDIHSKLRGLKHVYAYYLGKPSQPIKLYNPYNNRECLHCHLGARSFEESEAHAKDPQMMSRIKANQLSCSTSECHNIIHNVGQLKDAPIWKEPAQ
ncbi:MAG: NapC/NirT family cytochrome c [Blastocatellia bacterium]|nr:NapC/NirT family cytochrome c [Blastocatellia bacterium]